MAGVGVPAAKMQRMDGFGMGFRGGDARVCWHRFGGEGKSDSVSVLGFGAIYEDVKDPESASLGKGLQLISGLLNQLLGSQRMGCTWRESEPRVSTRVQACELGLKTYMSEIVLECALRSMKKAGENRPGGAIRLFYGEMECAEGLLRQREAELSWRCKQSGWCLWHEA